MFFFFFFFFKFFKEGPFRMSQIFYSLYDLQRFIRETVKQVARKGL